MRIIEERIRDFRNIGEAVFLPDAGVNVICGENGQGKTNLIESVFLLTGAKSFRHAKDRELIRSGRDFSVIESRFEAKDREQTVRLTIGEKGRNASLNRGSERKASELAGEICCVVFSPDHLELVKGTPAQRRKFLDTALCQLSPRYYRDLKDYSRLLLQKNTLLKDARNISAAYDMLDVYDEGLAAAAAGIIAAREGFCSRLDLIASEAYASVSGGRERMSLSYSSTVQGETGRESCLYALRGARQDDLRAGFTTVGPHRDDLEILLDGESARTFASQGQQRTAVLALKMGEKEMFRDKLGEDPILLLDDVLSELDGSRQEFLLRRLGGSQSIVTCCDPDFIERQTGAAVFRMSGGRLERL